MPSSTSASEKNRRSRITAACAVCRAKRQKCSGSKPQCDQCRMHNEECWWSDQKKRGPAKDYLRSLQDRLQETERLLLGILPQVPDEIVGAVLQQTDASQGPSHQAWTSSLSGPEYWSRFQLSRLDHIREWQEHRANVLLRPSPQSSQPIPTGNVARFSDGARRSIVSDNQDMVMQNTSVAAPNGSVIESPATSGGWPAQTTATRLDERRYSEETRDACEALFSISNPRPPETKRAEYAPPGQGAPNPYPATATMTTTTTTTGENPSLPSQFPKHLFW